jgi:hypothetical protein
MTVDASGILARYPKSRPALPPAHARIYETHYRENRDGEGAANSVATRLERWMHRRVAQAGTGGRVLELGAGTLNHLRFESPFPAVYDVVEPFTGLYDGRIDVGRVRVFYRDIADIAATEQYDRIISIAVLEHLTGLPDIVARAGLLLAEGGTFAAGVPSEGGMLWHCAWRFGTGVAYYLRHRLDYADLMRHEHVNTADEILAVIGHFFAVRDVRRFPLNALHASLYTCVVARCPDVARCRAYLARD